MNAAAAAGGCCGQCDQIEKLFFQYLAIYYNENMPQGKTNFLK